MSRCHFGDPADQCVFFAGRVCTEIFIVPLFKATKSKHFFFSPDRPEIFPTSIFVKAILKRHFHVCNCNLAHFKPF